MKILILHQFYNTPGTGGALRSYYLARALADEGVQTIVLTTHDLPHRIIKSGEGVEVHYLPVTYNNRYGFFRRVYSFLKFVWNTVNYAGKFRDVDKVYAISTPLTTGLAAIWIKLRYRIPYYFEVGDLWPEAPIQMDVIRNAFLKSALYKLEKIIYEESDAIVALSPAIKAAIERKVAGKKVHMIPNMCDTEFFRPDRKDFGTEEKFGVVGKFVVSYVGTLGLANGLDYLIRCAALTKRTGLNIQFLLCGDGKVRDELINKVREQSLDNVTMVPFQNRDGVREILNVTDAVMVCYRPLTVLETGSPNKFFDGLAAGKLMILNFGGWLKEEVGNNQCGISVDPSNPRDFVEKIEDFLANADRLRQHQGASRKLAEEKYSRKILGNRFSGLFLPDKKESPEKGPHYDCLAISSSAKPFKETLEV